jgi:hypothetical protein
MTLTAGIIPACMTPAPPSRVPDPLNVCVLNGRAAVIPENEKVCSSLGLALKADTDPQVNQSQHSSRPRFG